MKRLAIIACCLLAACSPREESLLVRTVQSELQRCPTAAELDGLQGRLKWNYTTGLELKAFLDCSYMDELLPVREYVRDWYEAIIDSTGAIGGGYKEANYSLDHICPGWTLLKLVKSYPEEKYFKAIEQLYRQLQAQPRWPTASAAPITKTSCTSSAWRTSTATIRPTVCFVTPGTLRTGCSGVIRKPDSPPMPGAAPWAGIAWPWWK